MVDPDDAPVPGLAERFTLSVQTAPPIVIGTLATGGVREHHAVTGGRFTGTDVEGELVGGGETLLHRPDGLGVLEAVYLARVGDGCTLRLVGTGYRTGEGSFAGTRMTIVFEVDEGGTQAHLSTRAYVGERAVGASAYTIAEIL